MKIKNFKNISCFAGFLFFLSASIVPALDFYGYAEAGIVFTVPEEKGGEQYESPVNPGNILGLDDVLYSTDLSLKMEDMSEKGSFSFWVSIEKSANDTAEGDDLYGLEIMRLFYSWDMTDSLRLSIGRKGFLTGYGYGWNPMDLVNPLKDPSDPDKDMTGVDAVSLLADSGELIQSEVFMLVSTKGEDSVEYEDLKAGGIATLLLPLIELKMTAMIGSEYALGGGFLIDIMGAGIYGEGVMRERSRISLPGGAPDYTLSVSGDPVYSALLGFEYVFESELTVTVEYFYNGEGLNQADRENYRDSLAYYTEKDGAAPDRYYEIYRPGYFAKHYMLVNLFYPLYSLFSEANISFIASPDSATIAISPEWVILPDGNLEISFGWNGFYSLDDDKYGEAWLSPVNNVITLKGVYHF